MNWRRTREQLLQEERLAAVGRLSSAIAHEIRNPVAMISSSIATAKQLAGAEREEMFEIASAEATRLVTLTTDFLDYARPRPPTTGAYFRCGYSRITWRTHPGLIASHKARANPRGNLRNV